MGCDGDGKNQEPGDGERMEQVARLLGEVCHELFQPMQSISGYSELLMMGIQKEHPHYGNLKKIKEHVDRLIMITRKLIDIPDMARNKISAVPTSCSAGPAHTGNGEGTSGVRNSFIT